MRGLLSRQFFYPILLAALLTLIGYVLFESDIHTGIFVWLYGVGFGLWLITFRSFHSGAHIYFTHIFNFVIYWLLFSLLFYLWTQLIIKKHSNKYHKINEDYIV